MAKAVMTIGAARISRCEELRIRNHIATFTKDQELLAAHRYWLYPHFIDDHGDFDLVFQSWIVEVDGRVVLIDPCNGNGRPHVVPFFNMLDIPYIERMQASGYRPQDVDFVVCTHLHHDHCGWNTQLRAGRWVPTFPKARYIIRLQEYERLLVGHATLGPADYNRGVYERSVEPVMKAGLVDLVSGQHQLTAAVTVEPAYGHTFGHQMVRVASAGRHALFTGDCFHHPVQLVDPTIPFAGGDDMQQVVAMRRRLVELSADLDACLIAAHVQAPYAVRASRAGSVFHFLAGP